MLIDKSLKTYNPTYIRGRARLIAQKAEAFFGKGDIFSCEAASEEAITMAKAIGSRKTVARIENLHASLLASRWENEAGIARLGALINL